MKEIAEAQSCSHTHTFSDSKTSWWGPHPILHSCSLPLSCANMSVLSLQTLSKQLSSRS